MLRELNGTPEAIGGIADHVHVLVGLKPSHCLADVVRDLKRSSSIWIHEEIGQMDFAWQEGYAAFTVSATMCDRVKGYIVGQEEHHRRPFRDELRELLLRAEIEFEDRFLD